MATLEELHAQHRAALEAIFADVTTFAETLTIRDVACVVAGTVTQLAKILADDSIPHENARTTASLYMGLLTPLVGQAHNDAVCDRGTQNSWNEILSIRLAAINEIRMQIQAASR